MESWVDIAVFGLVQLFMLVGLIGLVVPVFPGLLVMWLASLGYGIIKGFDTVGIIIFILVSLLALTGSFADNVLMGVGARRGGASWITILVALTAGILGTIIFPPIGGIIAAPLAVLGLEYLRLRDWKQAWLALRGLATGWGLSFVLRLAIGLLIMGLWWGWVWANLP